MKKMLFIYNPNSGMGLLKPKLSDVLDIFVKAGFDVTVYPTQKYHDAIRKMREYTEDYDLIVCSGGDGTLDEVVSGMRLREKQGADRLYSGRHDQRFCQKPAHFQRYTGSGGHCG